MPKLPGRTIRLVTRAEIGRSKGEIQQIGRPVQGLSCALGGVAIPLCPEEPNDRFTPQTRLAPNPFPADTSRKIRASYTSLWRINLQVDATIRSCSRRIRIVAGVIGTAVLVTAIAVISEQSASWSGSVCCAPA